MGGEWWWWVGGEVAGTYIPKIRPHRAEGDLVSGRDELEHDEFYGNPPDPAGRGCGGMWEWECESWGI